MCVCGCGCLSVCLVSSNPNPNPDPTHTKYIQVLESRALCHGDLHPGSIMVNSDGICKIIDPEFTVYGPPGLDVGSVLSGLETKDGG